MFLYNASRRTVATLGLAYVAGVYASYFATGLGIALLAVNLPAVPHFLSRVGAGLMVFFGMANVLNFYRPGTIPTMVPNALGSRVIAMMRSFRKGTSFPAVIFVGTLVGLHNFPCACTGGIYMTFLGLIAGSPLFLEYLAAYNAVFVVPLLSILAICSSKAVAIKLRRWRETNDQTMRLGLGLVMTGAGLVILTLAVSGLV